jgi:hypothetical protein
VIGWSGIVALTRRSRSLACGELLVLGETHLGLCSKRFGELDGECKWKMIDGRSFR